MSYLKLAFFKIYIFKKSSITLNVQYDLVCVESAIKF